MANAFKKRSKLLDVVKNMPPLHHTIPNEEFDIKKSLENEGVTFV